MSVTYLKAALPPSCYRTGTKRWTLCLARGEAVSIPPADDTLPTAPSRSRRFAWPSGGTEEFLGRWFARTNSRHTEAKGALADPLYVFGAAGRTETPGVVSPDRDGNRNDRTSRRRQQGRPLVTRGITVQNRSSSSREFRGARLDFSVHICVRPLAIYVFGLHCLCEISTRLRTDQLFLAPEEIPSRCGSCIGIGFVASRRLDTNFVGSLIRVVILLFEVHSVNREGWRMTPTNSQAARRLPIHELHQSFSLTVRVSSHMIWRLSQHMRKVLDDLVLPRGPRGAAVAGPIS